MKLEEKSNMFLLIRRWSGFKFVCVYACNMCVCDMGYQGCRGLNKHERREKKKRQIGPMQHEIWNENIWKEKVEYLKGVGGWNSVVGATCWFLTAQS